jgi:hypothetical protein
MHTQTPRPEQNATEHVHQHTHPGTASMLFMGKYMAITNLHYRLSAPSGERFEGQSNANGESGTIVLMNANGQAVPGGLAEPVWPIMDKVQDMCIQIEVRRDDGTWKNIGSFMLEANRHKLITAQIDTIKMPFQLGLVSGDAQTPQEGVSV